MTMDTDQLLVALRDEDYGTRCDALRACCPCRNGNLRERGRAAHAIGTLMEKAVDNAAWRGVLREFKADLDALRRDPPTSRLLLGQMKKHGHAHRGAAVQGYRRRRKMLDLATPAELAAWVNGRLRLAGRRRVSRTDPGIQRLWRWMKHRVQFQPTRRTSEAEIVKRAVRYLPGLFEQAL